MGIVNMRQSIGDWSWSGAAAYTESTRQEIAIASATLDFSLSFGGVTTADVVILESDQALTINLNSNSGTDIPVSANKPFVITGGAITACYVSYVTGVTANVKFKIYGA